MKTNIKSPWVAIVIGLVAIGFGIYSYINTEKFMEDAIETTGVVVDVYEKKDSNNKDNRTKHEKKTNQSAKKTYCPIIEFVTEAGDTVEFKSINGSTDKNKYKVGDDIVVYYDPDNPVKARQMVKSNSMQPYFAGGIGLVFIVVGIFMFVRTKKKIV